MTPSTNQQCPKCGGAIAREDTAVVENPLRNETVTYMFCDSCRLGLETLWRCNAAKQWEEVFTLEFLGIEEPVNLGKFLQRLHDSRAA